MSYENDLKSLLSSPKYKMTKEQADEQKEKAKAFFSWWHGASVEEKTNYLLADLAPCNRNNCSHCKNVIKMIQNLQAYGQISEPPKQSACSTESAG